MQPTADARRKLLHLRLFQNFFFCYFFFLSLDRFSPISFSLPLERNDYNVLCFLFIIHFKLQKPHEALVTC
jgi:hypothetical protein